jgi:hypothetical protein
MAGTGNSALSLDVTPHSVVEVCLRFDSLLACLPGVLVSPETEVVHSSEMLVNVYQTTRRYEMPGYSILHNHCREPHLAMLHSIRN